MYSNCFINCWDRGIDVSKLIVYLFDSFSDLSVSNSHSLQFYCFLLCLLGVLIHYYVVYPFLIIFFALKTALSYINMPHLFLCLHGITFFIFLFLSLSLYLKWVSYRQCRVGLYFQSTMPIYLRIATFRWFTFNLIRAKSIFIFCCWFHFFSVFLWVIWKILEFHFNLLIIFLMYVYV